MVCASAISFCSIRRMDSYNAHDIRPNLSLQLAPCNFLWDVPSCSSFHISLNSAAVGAPGASSKSNIWFTAATWEDEVSCRLKNEVLKTAPKSFADLPAVPFAHGVCRPARLQAMHMSPELVTDTQDVLASSTASAGRWAVWTSLRQLPSLKEFRILLEDRSQLFWKASALWIWSGFPFWGFPSSSSVCQDRFSSGLSSSKSRSVMAGPLQCRFLALRMNMPVDYCLLLN